MRIPSLIYQLISKKKRAGTEARPYRIFRLIIKSYYRVKKLFFVLIILVREVETLLQGQSAQLAAHLAELDLGNT